MAKQTQNPGAPLLGVPFQLDFNGNIGSDDRTQTLLNVQPVLPIELTRRFSIVTRSILPLVGWPDATAATETTGALEISARSCCSPATRSR